MARKKKTEAIDHEAMRESIYQAFAECNDPAMIRMALETRDRKIQQGIERIAELEKRIEELIRVHEADLSLISTITNEIVALKADQDVIVDLYVDRVCPTDAHLTIVGRLWRCTDILPGGACETMDIPRGSTYAQAARQVKKDIPVLRRNWEQCQHNQREHVSV